MQSCKITPLSPSIKTVILLASEIIKSITKSEINDLVSKNLPYHKMVILIVGDKASNYEKLAKLGYELVELDLSGNKIN